MQGHESILNAFSITIGGIIMEKVRVALIGCGGRSGAQGVLSQNAAVSGAEVYHQVLFLGMAHDCNIHSAKPSLYLSSGWENFKISLAYGYA